MPDWQKRRKELNRIFGRTGTAGVEDEGEDKQLRVDEDGRAIAKLADKSGVLINPAKEDGNLALAASGIGVPSSAESASGDGSTVGILKRLRTILTDVWDSVAHAWKADLIDRDSRILGRAKVLDSSGVVINPAKEDGNLALAASGIGVPSSAESASGDGSTVGILKRLRTILTDVWDSVAHEFKVRVTSSALPAGAATEATARRILEEKGVLTQFALDFEAGSLADFTVTASGTSASAANQTLSLGPDASAGRFIKCVGVRNFVRPKDAECFAAFACAMNKPNGATAGYRELVGFTNETDGFAIGYSGDDDFSLFIYARGNITKVPKTAWNGDPLDGSAGSLFTSGGDPVALDLAGAFTGAPSNFPRTYLWRFRFGHLRQSGLRLETLSPDGVWVVAHTFALPGQHEFDFRFTTLNLPFFAYAYTEGQQPNIRVEAFACGSFSPTTETPVPTSSTAAGNIGDASVGDAGAGSILAFLRSIRDRLVELRGLLTNPSTGASTAPTAGNVASTILAADNTRHAASIQNDGAGIVRIAVGGTTPTAALGHRLLPGDVLSIPGGPAVKVIREGAVDVLLQVSEVKT